MELVPLLMFVVGYALVACVTAGLMSRLLADCGDGCGWYVLLAAIFWPVLLAVAIAACVIAGVVYVGYVAYEIGRSLEGPW